MDSLSKNNEWGRATEMPEDLLAPDDWRLKAILSYRKQTIENEGAKLERAGQRVKQYLIDNDVVNPYAQAYILRKIGLKQAWILKLTKLGKSDYYNHIAVLFRSKKRYGNKDILDVEMLLKYSNLNYLLEEKKWQIRLRVHGER